MMKATPVLDLMIYIKSYAPKFPEEDQTSVDREFAKLRGRLEIFGKKPMPSDARQWFDIASREVAEAESAYAVGDIDGGELALESAEAHFRRCVAGKAMKARFIVTPGGGIGET